MHSEHFYKTFCYFKNPRKTRGKLLVIENKSFYEILVSRLRYTKVLKS